MKIPFDPETFGDVAPGEVVTVTGEAVLSDDGSVLEVTSVEGVPFEDEEHDDDEDEGKEKKKEKKDEKEDEKKEERTLEDDAAAAAEASDAMGVLNAML